MLSMGETLLEVAALSKRKTDVIDGFGEPLASLRKAAGFTQAELAAGVGIMQRMVAYFKAPFAQAPPQLLASFNEGEMLMRRKSARTGSSASAHRAAHSTQEA